MSEQQKEVVATTDNVEPLRPDLPRPSGPPPIQRVEIHETERALIEKQIRTLDELKMQFAEFELQYEQGRRQMLQQLARADQNYNQVVGAIAQAHDIEPSNPAKGRWTFDNKKMVFTKVG